MEMAVITTATDFEIGVDKIWNFLESAQYFGYQPLILGWGQPWQGNVHKAQLASKAIKQLKDRYPVILCVDSYDMIFTDTPSALLRSFRKIGHPCVFGSEKICYPDDTKADKHPISPTPYRFLNGGGWIAESSYVDQLFDYIGFDRLPPALNDQDILQDALIANPNAIMLDYLCQIFQSMVLSDDEIQYNDNTIRNLYTGQYPKIIHGNGHVDMTKPMEWFRKRREKVSE